MARPGEESVRVETGKQEVWPTVVRGGLVDLCAPHKRMFEGYSNAANQIAADTGLPQDEHASMTSRTGTCAECARRSSGSELANQLNQALPPGYLKKLDESDRTPRRGFDPARTPTKALPPLPQSLNAAKPHFYYHGTAYEPQTVTDHWAEGSHHIPAGAELHPDEATAFKHAIRQWNDDEESEFPRVYRVSARNVGEHEPTSDGGIKLRAPVQGSEVEHDDEKHPPIKIEGEEGPILYHGTTHYHEADDDDLNEHEPPHEITPHGGGASFGPGVAHEGYSYATKRPETAWQYAKMRQENLGGGTPHVYRVTPKKPADLEEDPHYEGDNNRGNFSGDMRSKSGFHVLDEVPPTRHQHAESQVAHWDEHRSDDGDDEHYASRRMNRQSQAQQTNVHVTLRQGGDNVNVSTSAMTPERRAEIMRIREERKNRKRPTPGQADQWLRTIFTPIPAEELAAQRKAHEPKPEPLDDHEYSLNDVSKHYDWEGFDSHEIEHLVHNPEHATFTHEDVPVHSLRVTNEHGGLSKPHSYADIAGQDEDDEEWEHDRLRSLEQGHDEGAKIPPIVVVRHGEHHIIADGSHRAAVAAERGHTHIPAFVTERTIMPKTGDMGAGGSDPFEHEASRKTAALANPIGGHEWFHGTPYDHGEHGFADPADDHPLAYNEDDFDSSHWNTILGNHFTSDHEIADQFARGNSSSNARDDWDGGDDEDEGGVIHAKLHLKNPKVYKSEHDMDQEVHEFEHGQGNHMDNHIAEGGWDEWGDEAPHGYHHKGDSEHGPYAPHEYHREYGHPMATHWLNAHPGKFEIAQRYKQRLTDQGHDGVVYGNEFEKSLKHGKRASSAIAFHTHQIEVTGRHHPDAPCPTPKTASLLPFIASWDDDDDEKPQWCEDCNEEHTEDEGHAECAACGERHEYADDKNEHETAMTDWDHVYPHLGHELHRGLVLHLPTDVHDAVHDESRPMHERAHALAHHIGKHDMLGMHWTDNLGATKKFTDQSILGETQAIVHAHKPDREQIETDPFELSQGQVLGYDAHDENEVPMKTGSAMKVKGISWKAPGHTSQWKRHDFKEPMHMESLRKHAHDSGDSQRIFHCPFCGGGQVIGRSDGTTECEFCDTHFTVQVQPTFNSFPQTDPETGMPIQIPGMPGQIDGAAPMGMDPNMPPGAPGAPMGEEGDEESGNPFGGGDDADAGEEEGSDDDGGDDKPDFLKSKSFKTASGVALTEDQYLRYLAMAHAPDRGLMAALLRRSR